ncbi:aminotransferase class I/II-fold pyridoxal phosphate-dependent enzyme [Macrococcus equipercicus]|uniref:Aminotransferase class I/II-fold pyridoxal phosphate-dependent enzyme n=1 Tax=Macrococcus equipercicus TaxID=69967 RepID=A0A9Q9BQF3_9STAP|nr:aminotransferase class I/II-fold pyridoxal phosphate-dependent enzyme [Macrococcus equipercicus]KAA1036196.1 aminotransferase class I/II-fold pyridoxal phosphate-dependent enzyme [Macrococcus equipercicus]UTH13756.1 aminotransferase class I/II-fold pyridoxal phosphate-dependent enzyme [Macrococcus equipercicus]
MNPITDRLKVYAKEAISLHVPGHHNGTIGGLDLNIAYDMTEITGLDDYHHPEAIIKQSELSLKRHHSYQSRYIVNGTTTGILAVLQSITPESSVAIMRNVHKSVFNGLSLAGLNAYILPTALSSLSNQYSHIDLSLIDESHLQDVKLAVLTYPNYFGEIYNIKEVIQFFHERDIEVLVDEAHGAHFGIAAGFPVSAVHYGADYVVQSYHKTLPALTMGSVIHIHQQGKLKEQVLRYLSVLQTSSPSYLLLSSLEQAHHFYLQYDARAFWQKRELFIRKLSEKFEVIEVDDPLKLLIRQEGYSGSELQALLEAQFIYTELATLTDVLLVLPLWHHEDQFPFARLLSLIEGIEVVPRTRVSKVLEKNELTAVAGFFKPVEGTERRVALIAGIGHYIAEALIPYPPGIPFVLAGEKLTSTHIAELEKYTAQGIRIHGMMDGKITIVE